MNLSKRSWHYKLYRYLRNFIEDGPIIPFYKTSTRVNYQPKSLCSYFWTTVFLVLLFPILLAVLIAAGIILAATAIIWWPSLAIYRHQQEKKARIRQALLDAYRAGTGPHPDEVLSPAKPKGDNLLVAWVKAYKKKHCPLITLVD